MTKETWREVSGYPGYLVSSAGQVKSKRRVVQRKSGPQRVNERIMKFDRNTKGYDRVRLYYTPGKSRLVLVNRLVATAFLPPPHSPKSVVRHKNGIAHDNRRSNLEWGTQHQNEHDKVRHGTSNRGERNAASKLTRKSVGTILSLHAMGVSARTLAEKFSVSSRTVRDIVSGKTWAWLGDGREVSLRPRELRAGAEREAVRVMAEALQSG